MKNILLFCLLLINACAFAQAPNFVFVLADDMGWTGTSVQVHPDYVASASDFYETPNLEALAASGMTFSSAYAPAPKCSPTRCSILTGQSTARNGFTETGNQGPTDEVLLAGITPHL
jgi:arylsulfatase A-like enzyme